MAPLSPSKKRKREKKSLRYTVKAYTFKLLQGKNDNPPNMTTLSVGVCFKRGLVNLKCLSLFGGQLAIAFLWQPESLTHRVGFACWVDEHFWIRNDFSSSATPPRVSLANTARRKKKTPKGQRSFHHMFLSSEFFFGSLIGSAVRPAESVLLQSPLDKGILCHLPLIISKMQSAFDRRKHDLFKVSLLVSFYVPFASAISERQRRIFSQNPVFFPRAQKHLKACLQYTRFFKVARSLPSILSEPHTYFATGWKLHVSGPGSLVLGSEGHWCQRSTDSLWSFLVSRTGGDLQEEIQHGEEEGSQVWISTSALCSQLHKWLVQCLIKFIKTFKIGLFFPFIYYQGTCCLRGNSCIGGLCQRRNEFRDCHKCAEMTALVKQSLKNTSIMMLAAWHRFREHTQHTDTIWHPHKYTLKHACLHVHVSP